MEEKKLREFVWSALQRHESMRKYYKELIDGMGETVFVYTGDKRKDGLRELYHIHDAKAKAFDAVFHATNGFYTEITVEAVGRIDAK